MITSEQKNIAQWAMDYALHNGCQAARISIITAKNNAFEYRDEQLDKLHQSSENKLFIELFTNGRYGSFATNRIKKTEIELFIKDAIVSTNYLAEDGFRQLPNPLRYYKNDGADLDIYDKSFDAIGTDKKLEIAQQAIDEIYKTDQRIVSIASSYDDTMGAEYMIASNGFEAETIDTYFSLSCEVALKTDGDARPESYWHESALFWNDLKTNNVGKTALKRALRKIGQQKVKSGKYAMLLDNTVSARLLSPMISAMFGGSLQQKNSFLINKLDTQIASEKLTITDTPHVKHAFGARWFDGEGIATEQRPIIEKGILKTYFIDTYNALKMGVTPTIGSPSILNPNFGSLNFDQILQSMHKGIWVTGFNGGNSNPTTGDFSFGVEGYLIENGLATTPISEMNITGNLIDLWLNLVEVGNDPQQNTSRLIPSLLFDDVNFSGL